MSYLVSLTINVLWQALTGNGVSGNAHGEYTLDALGGTWSDAGFALNAPDDAQHTNSRDIPPAGHYATDVDWSLPNSAGQFLPTPPGSPAEIWGVLPPDFAGGPTIFLTCTPPGPAGFLFQVFDIWIAATFSDASVQTLRPAAYYSFNDSGQSIAATPNIDGAGLTGGASAFDGDPATYAAFAPFLLHGSAVNYDGAAAVYYNFPPPIPPPPPPPAPRTFITSRSTWTPLPQGIHPPAPTEGATVFQPGVFQSTAFSADQTAGPPLPPPATPAAFQPAVFEDTAFLT